MSSERPGLPQRLREETRDLHHAAERSGVMAALLAGRLPRAGYLVLLHNLQPIYVALEAALQTNAAEPWLAGLDLAGLQRGAALAADLSGSETVAAAVPTRAYADRLHALAARRDPALLAHAYTRCLGDLHGGQILRRVVREAYPGMGTAFHDFGSPEQVLALRDNVRAVLAAAPAGAADPIVAEARWSFTQHIAIFEALA
jgi:heme oxygenase (biliverdin-producing, ferredoxin)